MLQRKSERSWLIDGLEDSSNLCITEQGEISSISSRKNVLVVYLLWSIMQNSDQSIYVAIN